MMCVWLKFWEFVHGLGVLLKFYGGLILVLIYHFYERMILMLESKLDYVHHNLALKQYLNKYAIDAMQMISLPSPNSIAIVLNMGASFCCLCHWQPLMVFIFVIGPSSRNVSLVRMMPWEWSLF